MKKSGNRNRKHNYDRDTPDMKWDHKMYEYRYGAEPSKQRVFTFITIKFFKITFLFKNSRNSIIKKNQIMGQRKLISILLKKLNYRKMMRFWRKKSPMSRQVIPRKRRL